jgi:hypothetical protein
MEPDTTGLTKKLKQFSQTRGADLFGIADLTPVQSYISSQGPSWISGFPRAVSIEMQLNDQVDVRPEKSQILKNNLIYS